MVRSTRSVNITNVPGTACWKPIGGWKFGNTIDGCQAEYVLVHDAMANLAPVPDGLDLEIAAAAMLQGLTAHALTHSVYAIQPGDSVLIHAEVRKDERANAAFLEVLTGRRDPETVLRWMNEAGVFGRFVPDFGRVNAQVQFDRYHHYTVD